MKLFLLEIHNGLEYGDYQENQKLAVAKDKVGAAIIAIDFMHESFGGPDYESYGTTGYRVTEIEEVDGYKINLEKVTE